VSQGDYLTTQHHYLAAQVHEQVFVAIVLLVQRQRKRLLTQSDAILHASPHQRGVCSVSRGGSGIATGKKRDSHHSGQPQRSQNISGKRVPGGAQKRDAARSGDRPPTPVKQRPVVVIGSLIYLYFAHSRGQ